MTFVPQRSFFCPSCNDYDRKGDGDTFSNENFILGRPHFHVTSHLSIEAKVFFSQMLTSHVIHEYHIIATEAFLKYQIVT